MTGQALQPRRIVLALVTAMAASPAVSAPLLEEVTIIGNQEAAREIAGSGALIDSLQIRDELATDINQLLKTCLLYTSPSPRDLSTSRMPSSA